MIKKKKIKDIKYDKESGKINREVVELFAQSIKEIGLSYPIVVDKENNLIEGHYEIEAMRLLGNDEIDVTSVKTVNDRLDDWLNDLFKEIIK